MSPDDTELAKPACLEPEPGPESLCEFSKHFPIHKTRTVIHLMSFSFRIKRILTQITCSEQVLAHPDIDIDSREATGRECPL